MSTELKVKKIIGWVLIASGIIIMASIITTTVSHFSSNTPFPELFSESIEIKGGTSDDPLSDYMQSIISDQLNSFIPKGSITLFLNIGAWIIFSFFMVFASARISELGLKMLKE
ncbi:MAG: hypothetical protein ACOXZP_01365 [Minisyncoccales bacterium]|jgi:predicted PurR-regulated permease PerM|nr:hypothetical protein [Candidatus Paceibacterota bacterium]NMB47268.1 hypothetical protein [Patescibacteria group bacterium]